MRLILSSLLMHKIKLLSVMIFFITARVASTFSNETDRLALLAFKDLVTGDPLGSLSSWNNSLSLCEWHGITCSRKHQRVVALDMRSKGLSGSVSPSIGNLSFLEFIFLQDNHFQGNIPPELSRLFRLRHLNLSENFLQGEIPANLSHCPDLNVMELIFNNLVGKIPASLGSLSKLTSLALFSNRLTREIPSSLGNLTLLKRLSLGANNLTGTIPNSIGHLSNLKYFGVGLNKLSGTVPPSLYNISTLTDLVIPENNFTGSLPPDIGLTLPNLEIISVGGQENQFWGPFPVSFSNASQMKILDLNGLNLSGPVPSNLGRKMKDLRWLNLGGNIHLGSGGSSDLRFIDSLINCSKLRILAFDKCGFGGSLPTSIVNLSSQLNILAADDNQLVGTIPAGISNFVNLFELDLQNNFFSGAMPFGIGKLRNLQQLDFSGNKLSGPIPLSIGNLTKMFHLNLAENYFNGSIPSSIDNLLGLQILNLSYNILVSMIPETLGLFSTLTSLNLAHNSFIGPLPLEIGALKHVQELDISDNKLSGDIPSTLGNCLTLERLVLGGNTFWGTIPPSFSSLKGIEILDLSRNNLSGQIPRDLATLGFLKNLNLSFNNLSGEVPSNGVFRNMSRDSLVGNTDLCGGIAELQLPTCPRLHSKKKGLRIGFKIIVLIACVVVFLTLIPLLVVFLGKRKQEKTSPIKPSSGDDFLRVSYDQLIKATNGFSSSNLIGAGSFGSVYKGILAECEKPIAVKVFNLEQRGASKSFMAECEALRNTRHRNLLKIVTACSSVNHEGDDFKALVYEYMPNGSLENWLHPGENVPSQARNLDLSQRLNIAIDVVGALDYLHHRCEAPIVHCDLKPSNILIDEDMTALVGDFGLARFLIINSSNSGGGQTNSQAIKGSIGYVAPEYGICGKLSTKGDVYSYGILLLEMLTRKRPTDEMFTDGRNLHKFCKLALPDQVMEIVDSGILLEEPNEVENDSQSDGVRQAKIRECLISLMAIGVACSVESPEERMDIKDVIVGLTTIKEVFLGVGIHGRKQLQMQLAGEGTSTAGYRTTAQN
ncbi:probable LRR receptor-like serine/threonine-protein kinase At3g47570 [Actinidia eriantha]|uniref:probable LRR receptor-like serine/threonine-protein kinase At3g47570 n=1 Tax=Actinidia eriantha TaxID=165200 RepID=UPI00258794ED|nr:probable LRR receptor-like serine/threonine-protein kinase At3g47570 [Actinidia eriantha]